MPEMVPVNMSVEDVHAAAGLGTDAPVPTAPSADDLDNWAQEAYSLSVSTAANLGFPVGNINATYKRDALMFGTSRWKDVASGDHTYRFGVALRSIVVVSEIQGSGALTLPVVAAKVEIEGARASAQLLVRGYKGNALGISCQLGSLSGSIRTGSIRNPYQIPETIMADAGNIPAGTASYYCRIQDTPDFKRSGRRSLCASRDCPRRDTCACNR